MLNVPNDAARYIMEDQFVQCSSYIFQILESCLFFYLSSQFTIYFSLSQRDKSSGDVTDIGAESGTFVLSALFGLVEFNLVENISFENY